LEHKGSKLADDYQKLKLDNDKNSAIEEDLADAEKDSDITVVPTQDGSRYPTFTQGTRYPTINRGITVRPVITRITINRGITISPIIVGTTISPTINRGITISPTITVPTINRSVNGVNVGGALPSSDDDGIDL
jgi:hypothetical protein